MAASTSNQQANGANTLIVPSSLIPLSSASQLTSSVNSSTGLNTSQPSLIATQNTLAHQQHFQQQPFLQVFPSQDPFHLQQIYQQQQQMFLSSNLTVQNSIPTHTTSELNSQSQKKKINKQQKIISKSQNQMITQKSNLANLSTAPMIKSVLPTTAQQFPQNNQTVVISQLPSLLPNSQQRLEANKKLLDSQKNKHIMLQNTNATFQSKPQLIHNNALAQQSIVGTQFKPQMSTNSPAHLLAHQSPLLNQPQLLGVQQIPQSPLTWAQPNTGHPLMSSSQIFIRQPHTGTEGQPLFIQGSNPSLQTVPGASIYVNHNSGIMHLVPNHNNLNGISQTILTTSSNASTTSTANNSTITNTTQSKQNSSFSSNGQNSTTKLKAIRPASSNQVSNSNKINKPQLSSVNTKSTQEIEKKIVKKSLDSLNDINSLSNKSKVSTKTTQQMNAELLASANLEKSKLQKSELLKSTESLKVKTEVKIKKDKKDLDDESLSSQSSCNKTFTNGFFKKEKSEKKIKQKAIVKPQILKHCIDGYIIHESSFPFPVNGNDEKMNNKLVNGELNDELEQIKINNGESKLINKPQDSFIVKNKEGKLKSKKLKKLNKINKSNSLNKNLMSVSSHSINDSLNADQQLKKNLSLTSIDKIKDLNGFSNTDDSKNQQNKNILSNTKEKKLNIVSVAPMSDSTKKSEDNVFNWTVDDVYEFIKQHSSEEIAKELKDAQIDGKALTLLNISILREKFKFKLGPILSLNKKIDELKEKVKNLDYHDNYLPAGGSIIYKWTVKDVYDFVHHLTSKEHAEEFERQEMDGHALTLLSEENLRSELNIKYGPGLKIFTRIEELKKNSTST